MTPAIKTNPRTWTLRFKYHRSTILLHVDSLQKFRSIRIELLKAIKETSPTGTLNGVAIPQSADDILLAKPNDINNLKAGWKSVEKEDDAFAADESAKGKAKAGKGKNAMRRDHPLAAGLKDGGVVAFKFRSESQTARHVSAVADSDDKLVLDGEPETWDVVAPTLEETYAEEDAEMDER